MRRYLKLLWIQLRSSMLLALQYRWDFLVDGAISLFYAVTAVAPLLVVFSGRDRIAGWTAPEALLVSGWFILLDAIIDGAISPSLTSVTDHIRQGTLDFVLLKPADAQFLVSTARFQPWKLSNGVAALAVFVYSFQKMGRTPHLVGAFTSVALLGVSTVLLYSLWILTVSAAFYVVKVDNLSYLFTSIFDAARWPATVFKGTVRFLFTFVIPLALMTTYPAEALLGRLEPYKVAASILGTVAFAAFARLVWLRSIAKYTSASG
ncbi:MAG TPA: ABC-2 family transporter protein [Myxococcaceae bacterium]|nr:ABC-2 family transporter protein [Myxococcaceae bacterium]